MNEMNTALGREERHAAYTVTSRKWIAQGLDVHVKEFTLAVAEEVPWHHHSIVADIFYCLEGQMKIERAEVATGNALPELDIAAGASAKVDVGTAHRVFNPGPGRCRFLIVQGVGHYDYLPYQPAKKT
jgi:mannose-6-phosphate isomerase-like protein (cupin superfamily)